MQALTIEDMKNKCDHNSYFVYHANFGCFPSPNSNNPQLYDVTSGFARLSMKAKSIF